MASTDLSGAGDDGEITNVYHAEAVIKINGTAPDEIFGPVNREMIIVSTLVTRQMNGFLYSSGPGEPDDKLQAPPILIRCKRIGSSS